jgi:hypothetical protein
VNSSIIIIIVVVIIIVSAKDAKTGGKNVLEAEQGDQIGRIFATWATLFVGQFF